MASSREERMQWRLRGAQRREVKDVDFGFDFGAPTLPPPPSDAPVSTRRSPRRSLGLAPQPSSRSTPASRSLSQPPVASPQDEKNTPKTGRAAVVAAQMSTKYANTSAKRRKLDTDASSASIRSAASAAPAPHRDIYAIEADKALEPEAAETTNRSTERSTIVQPPAEDEHSNPSFALRTAEMSPGLVPGEVEVTESPTSAPGSGHRIRTIHHASFQSSRSQDELQMDDKTPAEPPGSSIPQGKRKRATSAGSQTLHLRQPRQAIRATGNNVNETNEFDELSPEQSKRGRRRRSSIQRELSAASVPAESAEDREVAEEIDGAQSSTVLKKGRNGRFTRAPAEASPELGEPSGVTLPVPKRPQGRFHPDSSPVVQRQPKKTYQKSKSSTKPVKHQIRAGSPIQITVYRLTDGPVYEEDDSDPDILNSEVPYSKRKEVNVVDVFGGLGTEMIDLEIAALKDSLSSTEDPALERDGRNKLRVVEAFRREFEIRLAAHTFNLDNTASLGKRIRDENKKRQSRREEITQVRIRREKIALRADAIRIAHERESRDAQGRDTLNTAVHDIELAVERGKKSTKDTTKKFGVELLLKRIAGEISNKSYNGGLLHQIKAFNAFLERTALALESRKA